MHAIKGYRTIIFNVLMMIISVITVIMPEQEVPTEAQIHEALNLVEPAVVAVWGIGNIIIRAFTNTPIAKKE